MLVLTVFFSVFLFAETGYKGIEWYSNITEIQSNIDIYEYTALSLQDTTFFNGYIRPEENVYIADAVILGERVKVCYYLNKDFGAMVKYNPVSEKWGAVSHKYLKRHSALDDLFNEYGSLNAISYIINRKKVLALKQKLGNVLLSYPIIKSEKSIPKDISQEAFDVTMKIMLSRITYEYEEHGEEVFDDFDSISCIAKKNQKAPGTLSLYDYNDDTRVYIYDNIIKDKAVVVYVPHEQDY